MSLRFEHFLTEGIAQLSYLVGDDDTGAAAVIDPRTDVEIYIKAARRLKLAITHVFETHIHADFVSGARELSQRLGGAAQVHLSREGGARYGFPHKSVRDGQIFQFGKLLLTAKHTPGHTPEHVSYLLAEKKHATTPWGVLTGDSLFVNSAGRPDLLGSGKTDDLADQLFDTLQWYLSLADHVMIFPGHGHGSPCGADIGDRLASTIGYERRFNPFLKLQSRDDLRQYAEKTAPPVPTYYPRMKKVNADGPDVLGGLPKIPGLPPRQFKSAIAQTRAVLVDTRSMLAFGGGHIKGALNIGARAELSIWAGWILTPQRPILLVLEDETDLEAIIPLFLRTGYSRFAGYLVGGMKAWDNAGLPIQRLEQKPVHEITGDGRGLKLLDVRSPGEWEEGHMPGAEHRFLPELHKRVVGLNKHEPIAVYCDSGYRASLAASMLQLKGFEKVYNVPGSWQAWTNAGRPVAQDEGGERKNRNGDRA